MCTHFEWQNIYCNHFIDKRGVCVDKHNRSNHLVSTRRLSRFLWEDFFNLFYLINNNNNNNKKKIKEKRRKKGSLMNRIGHTSYTQNIHSCVHLDHIHWATSAAPNLHSNVPKAIRHGLKLQTSILASLKHKQFFLKLCENPHFHSPFGFNLLESIQAFSLPLHSLTAWRRLRLWLCVKFRKDLSFFFQKVLFQCQKFPFSSTLLAIEWEKRKPGVGTFRVSASRMLHGTACAQHLSFPSPLGHIVQY